MNTVEETVMQEERRCPRCKHGRHKEHVAEFLNKANQVTVCRCEACVPVKKAA